MFFQVKQSVYSKTVYFQQLLNSKNKLLSLYLTILAVCLKSNNLTIVSIIFSIYNKKKDYISIQSNTYHQFVQIIKKIKNTVLFGCIERDKIKRIFIFYNFDLYLTPLSTKVRKIFPIQFLNYKYYRKLHYFNPIFFHF